MRQLFYRFLAYLVTGALLGAAGWMALSAFMMETGFPTVPVIACIAGGILAAVLLLRQAAIGIGGGIRINSAMTVAMMDGVAILAATIVSLFVLDGKSEWITGEAPVVMDDPLALDVVMFMYLPAALLLAAFITGSGGQTLAVDRRGLTIAGAFGANTLDWGDITRFAPDEQWVVVSRVGLPIPRHLRTNLEIRTGDGECFTIYEPEFRSVKTRILDLLRSHAPGSLYEDLDAMASVWLG